MLVILMLEIFPVMSQNMTGHIKGKITDTDNNPVPFANVLLVELNIGTISDENGMFRLRNITSGNYTLQLSCVGYKTHTDTVTITGNKETVVTDIIEENAIELSHVMVTAEKRYSTPQKMSSSISALNALKIKNAQVESLNDLTGMAPNLFVVNGGGDRALYSIRGIYASSLDPSVAVYVDGVLQYDANSTLNQLSGVERIEVLRGPQGTLYGRNAMAGVINIITEEPGNKATGFAEAGVGNYNSQRYSLGIKTPLVKDKLFFGISGFYNKRDGYFDNTVTGESFDDLSNCGGNFSLKWKALPSLAFTLNSKYQHTENKGSFPYATNDSIAFADGYKTTQDATGTEKINKIMNSLNIKYNNRLCNINSITAFQYTNFFIDDGYWDGDWTVYDLYGLKYDGDAKDNYTSTFSQEFRFSNPQGNNDSKIDWLTGVYYMYTVEKEQSVTLVGNDAALFGDTYAPYNLVAPSRFYNSGGALFGNTTWHITGQFDLTAGLRYDWEEKIWHTQTDFVKDGYPATSMLSPKRTHTDFDALSPKAVFTWMPDENKTYYVSYTKGYRGGGINKRSSSTDADATAVVTYAPEHSHNFELAGKHLLLDNRLMANLTLFYILWEDMQISTFNPSRISTSIQNAGKAESKGVELELQYKPVKKLTIDYNTGITSGEYTKMKAPNITTQTETDYKGNTLVMQPEYTSTLAVLYNLPLTENAHLMFRPEWQSIGKQYFDVANTIKQEAYNIFNLKVAYMHKCFEISLWTKNIFDKKYIGYGYSNSTYVMLGTPATFGATVRAQF